MPAVAGLDDGAADGRAAGGAGRFDPVEVCGGGDKEEYCKSCVINSGDIVLLFGGSHGFKILEDLEMIEIKQGPYVGDLDKTKFKRIDDSKIIIH